MEERIPPKGRPAPAERARGAAGKGKERFGSGPPRTSCAAGRVAKNAVFDEDASGVSCRTHPFCLQSKWLNLPDQAEKTALVSV